MPKRRCSLDLGDYGLTQQSFRALGDRLVTLRIHFSYPSLRKLLPFKPAIRKKITDDILNNSYARFHSRWGRYVQKPIGDRRRKSGAVVAAPANVIRRMLSHSFIVSAFVSGIAGMRPRKKSSKSLGYFAVCGIYVVQIEGVTRGLQSYEERIVLVKAKSFDDAERKVRLEAKSYGTPYLNSDGQLVRWQLEKIVDVYDTAETEFPDGCFEVYSDLRSRRMKPVYVWRPKDESRNV